MTDEFIVMGAGALGLASAEALLLQGATVTVLERGAVGRESSWAGGGILAPLCPWDYPDVVTQLTTRGAALFGAWAERLHRATGIDPEYQVSGMLVQPPLDIEAAELWCAAHGMPAVRTQAGLLLPEVAQVRNPRLLQALRARVEQLGGRIVEHCAVQAISVEHGSVNGVHTERGMFRAQRYLVTAGAWSNLVAGERAGQADIKPVRGQMLLFKFATPPLRHILLQDGLYLIPRKDGHLLVGSTLEDVGFDKSTTASARELLLQRALTLLPALRDQPLLQQWSGLRPGSPANVPRIGRHFELENLYINSGHFRYGVTMAPASIEVLLGEINGGVGCGSPYQWRA